MRHLFFTLATLCVAACDVHVSAGGGVWGQFPGLDGSATKTEDVPLELKAGDTLDASSDYGAIRLRVDDKASPNARVTITIRAKTDGEAQGALAKWRVRATRSGSTVSLRADGVELEADVDLGKIKIAPQVEIEAVVPSGVAARATSRFGDVRADGAFSRVELQTAYGKVAASGARGDVVLRTDSGDATVQDATGGRVEARSKYGAVRLSKIVAARVEAQSNSGEVVCEDGQEGDYDLSTSYGDVRVRGGSGSLSAKSKSGRVQVSFDGKVVAHSNYGDVTVAGVLTSADATGNSGKVSVEARAGSKAQVPWTVRSGYGDVTLRVPDDFACNLELASDYGSLAADHPGLCRGPDREAKEMRDKIGAGGETVIVRTKSGSARVERSTR